MNGAPFQLGWGSANARDCEVEDIVILRNEITRKPDKPSNTAFLNLKGQDARCFHRDVASYVDRMKSRPDDVIILDPPRSGLGRALCLALNEQGAGTLVLIGCDGAEFCRDLKLLSQNWRLEKLESADLFPWTVHCEFAALLSNRAI